MLVPKEGTVIVSIFKVKYDDFFQQKNWKILCKPIKKKTFPKFNIDPENKPSQ